MGTNMSLKIAALLLLFAFLVACDNTKQVEIGITEIRYHISNSDYEKAVAALDSIKEYIPKEMISKLEDEINHLPPVEVSVLDLLSNDYKYIGKTIKILGYMSWNNTGDREFYLGDSKYNDEPHVVVSYGNCSNLREIITQDARRLGNQYLPVEVVGILHGKDKIKAKEVRL